jgi:predicted NUDIX family NTP pyrophosphohydrolase
MIARSRLSAGLLLYRHRAGVPEFLLVHPGGPFFIRKDEGSWSIPKGEAQAGEDLFTRAKIEFEEELGFIPCGNFLPLGSVKQKGGKTVHAWAVEGDLPDDFTLRSNTFELEWPPRSGRMQSFPEIDRAEFFPEKIAREKINAAQLELIDRLVAAFEAGPAGGPLPVAH